MHNHIYEIYSMEQLSAGDSFLHQLHPMCKLLAASVFILTVISFNQYDFGRMVPYIFYPALLMALSETPYAPLLKRFVLVAPFCLFIGISNVFLDRGTAFSIGTIPISFGLLSLCVIMYRAFLCVMAVLLLAAVTPFAELTAQFRRLRMPNICITLFEMTYRYTAVLFGEAASMHRAYILRSANGKGVDIRHAGTFIGCLLLRSFDRGERVYAAMKCRGYGMESQVKKSRPLLAKDLFFCILVCSLCILFRFVDAGRLFIFLAERVG